MKRDGLLPRMEARRGKSKTTYRYHPIDGKPIGLGSDLQAAIRKVNDMTGRAKDTGTIAKLWEQYQESNAWKVLADSTKEEYKSCGKQIVEVFADMYASDIRSPMIYRYLTVERKDAPVRANREVSLLSNLIDLAIRRGEAETNPCSQVRRNTEQPRTKAIDPEELHTFIDWLCSQEKMPQRKVISMVAEFCAYAGSRKIECLDLAWTQIDEKQGVIRIKRAKQRGKKRGEVIDVIKISDALQDLIVRLKAIRKDGLYVFPTQRGSHYTAAGFKCMWGKLINQAKDLKVIEGGFTFHDLRAFYVTQFKQSNDGRLPDIHANPQTTARIYDRTKEVKRRAI
ncbi:tyrosine-type recombinase/integrase [Polynucleobacter paneuropaeus]|uniref:tyrosine-type recombinase/integrase n=1 Tax=Polynucleobacter paneuropaeus TaxID=2527775 RepID=UPI001FD185ED|nr:tyrosine-type recombinase/integrase [Polynucleobacter paneuropaeus]